MRPSSGAKYNLAKIRYCVRAIKRERHWRGYLLEKNKSGRFPNTDSKKLNPPEPVAFSLHFDPAGGILAKRTREEI